MKLICMFVLCGWKGQRERERINVQIMIIEGVLINIIISIEESYLISLRLMRVIREREI